MDGENNGKPYEQMDDLGGFHPLKETPSGVDCWLFSCRYLQRCSNLFFWGRGREVAIQAPLKENPWRLGGRFGWAVFCQNVRNGDMILMGFFAELFLFSIHRLGIDIVRITEWS